MDLQFSPDSQPAKLYSSIAALLTKLGLSLNAFSYHYEGRRRDGQPRKFPDKALDFQVTVLHS